MDQMDGKTRDNINDNLEIIKQAFPDAFSEGKVDFEKLQLLLGEDIINDKEKYSFTWKGKNDAIKVALAQNTGTLRPDKASSKNWDTTGNLYLEGDNLEVLRTLQDSYRGKVKMIYIDPPYNTGKDSFVYPDNYGESTENYKQKTEQDMKSNPDTSGRFHTDWLSMMYPRLKLARNLLKDDGVIFISIDDNEIVNLKKICDEIYGEENSMGVMVWHVRGRSKTPLSIDHEYILVYAKNKSNIVPIFDTKGKKANWYGQLIERKYFNFDGDERGDWRDCQHTVTETKAHYTYSINIETGEVAENENKSSNIWYYHKTWMYPPNTIKSLYDDNRLYFTWNKTKEVLMLKVKKFKNEEESVSALEGLIQRNYVSTRNGSEEFDKLFPEAKVFGYPKPTLLLKRLIESCTKNNDLIIDFFSGSGSTSDAIMQLNSTDKSKRKYIMVQIPEIVNDNNAGYPNICEIGKERIRRAGEKILKDNKDKEGIENLDVGFKVFKLDTTNLKKWETTVSGGTDYEVKEELQTRLTDMTNPVKEDRYQIDMIYEIMLKNGMDLSLPMEELDIGSKKVFSIASGYLIACLENDITLDTIKEICELKPKVTVFYDNSFKDDVVKLNAIEQLEKQEIQVRVI